MSEDRIDTRGKLSPARRLMKRLHPESIPPIGALFYNAVSGTSVFQHHYELVANDIATGQAEGRLLDIGTGPGRLLITLHQQSPRMRLIGIDSSPSMVAKARTNLARAGAAEVIEMLEGNASRLPFGDGALDMVVSTGSVHHWKDPIVALNEIYRVLKAGARALLYDVVSDTPQSVLDEMAREFGKLKTKMFWLHAFEEPFYSRENFAALAAESLFRKGETRFVGILCCLGLRKAR